MHSSTPPAAAAPWRFATRCAGMSPSALREILKLTERPGIVSLAGGLPSPESFPVEAVREASRRVLLDAPHQALQYAASEGHAPLREWVAAEMAAQGLRVDASQVLITTGSQQGLDLVGKAFIDAGSRVLVESPSYLGALQAFAAYEPSFVPIDCDGDGPDVDALNSAAADARFVYLQPNFQNPTGRSIAAARRDAVVACAQRSSLPIVEDNPYGELWFEAPPSAPIAARWSEGTVYLGTFSKVLSPGLRLGYLIAPTAVYGKLLQAKQAADLHTPGFNQRVVYEVIRDGFLRTHVPAVRERYRQRRDAMQAALAAHLPQDGPHACRWSLPAGGMFFWVELPVGVDAEALLPLAVERGVAFVPGASFFAGTAQAGTAMANAMRLSFSTVSAEAIERGVRGIAAALESMPRHTR